MPNYYEYLQIEPVATAVEIQVAIDEKSNQCRRMLTHNDPNVVTQANMALQSLDKIREILLNPEQKAVYDEALGLPSNIVGGLGDLQAASSGESFVVPPSTKSNQTIGSSATEAITVVGWHCSECQSINQAGTFFCKNCGNQIGQSCLKCNTVYEKAAKFCPSCGVSPQEFAEEQEKLRIENLERQKEHIRQKLNEAETQLSAGMFGLAKDAIGEFEGFGNGISKPNVICGKGETEWMQADAINQNANIMRTAFIKQNILRITIGYAAAGGSLAYFRGMYSIFEHISNVIRYQHTFDWSQLLNPFLNMLSLGIGAAIAGAVGSFVYFYQWGGRRALQKDLLFGTIAPLALAIFLPFSFYFFGAMLLVIVILFGILQFRLVEKLR